MTIRLPGFMEEINPQALQGIGSVLNNIVNPNWQQQAALRDMILKNPELQQQLVDMGPEQVESAYGKGTGKFAQGTKSLKKQTQDAVAPEMQRILALPQDHPDRVEWVNNQIGIDPVKRQAKELELAEIRQKAIEAEQLRAGESRVQRERVKFKNDIVATYQNGDAEVKATIFKSPTLKDEYERAVMSKAEEARIQLAKQNFALDVRRENRLIKENSLQGKTEAWIIQRSLIDASELTQLGLPTDAESIRTLMTTPTLLKQLQESPSAPAGQENLWQAAQNLKKRRELDISKQNLSEERARSSAHARFMSATADARATLKRARFPQKGMAKPTDEEIQSAIEAINYEAAANPTAFKDEIVTQFTYDPDEKAFGRELGIAGLKKVEAEGTTPRTFNYRAIQAEIDKGTYSLDDVINDAKNDAEKSALRKNLKPRQKVGK